MDPYRIAPRAKPPRPSSSSASALVLLIVGAWIALGSGAPMGKDFLLWAFTSALVILIAVLWRRGDAAPGPAPEPRD